MNYKLGSNTKAGIDNLAFKRKNGKIVDVIVVESKSVGTDGFELKKASYGVQMGTDWIEHHLEQIGKVGAGEFSEEVRAICRKMKADKTYKRVLTSVDEVVETLNLTFLETFK